MTITIIHTKIMCYQCFSSEGGIVFVVCFPLFYHSAADFTVVLNPNDGDLRLELF